MTEPTPDDRIRPQPERDQSRGRTGRLPSSLASLIGRGTAISTACTMLRRDDVRLVTFTGPGGVGKTQLALAVARIVNEAFADGIAFMPLAPIRDPNLVASAIAQVLNVADTSSQPLIDRLEVALRHQDLLLVLDNFEHVVTAAPLVTDLLAACPQLKALVTSRALLRVSGEHAFTVPPLALPRSTQPVSVDASTRSDAINLFVTRAQEVKPEFVVTDANASAIAEICRKLDGLPLAIELAAARVRALSPQALLAQMTTSLPLLTGGRRDAPERLQTMRQAIAWSYDLLPAEEQRLFRHLSVFVGGFTLDAAKAIMTNRFVLDNLTSLIDKSLVQQEERPNGETRFSLLETIREFGLEELEASGESEAVQARHAAFFLELVEDANRAKTAPEQSRARNELRDELPNIRAALSWAQDQHNANLLLHLTTALFSFWFNQGLWDEASNWQATALEATASIPPGLQSLRAKLLANTARFQTYRGNFERSSVLLTEGYALASQKGDTRATAEIEYCLGHLAVWRGDLENAEPHLEVALTLWRTLDDPDWVAVTLLEQGYVTRLKGDLARAEQYYAEALDEFRDGGWVERSAACLERLGVCVLEQGEYRRATEIFVEALTLAQDAGALLAITNCLRDLGVIAAAAGNAVQAARLFGASAYLWERHGFGQPAALERPRLEHAMAPARTQLSAEAFAAAWTAGRQMSLDQAIAEALAVARVLTSERPIGREAPGGLTPRELEVLCLLVEGLANKEIAETLGISRRTVSKHVEAIFNKLDVPSRAAAATYAARHGLI